MEVKKKITRQSYDYAKLREYYHEASICPNCGNDNIHEVVSSPVFAANKDGEAVRSYLCLKCGCKWEVEPYSEDSEEEA